ncbi:MAG: tetratricopeptide repeat protein [Rhodospirillaceae bacterium]
MSALTPKIAALLDKGLASHKVGDLQAAISAYSAVLKKKPLQADALWLKGVAFLGLGEPDVALEWLEKALRRRPTDAGILNDLGMAHEALGQQIQARKCFEDALVIDSNIPSVLANIARYELNDGHAVSALEMAARAAAIDPNLIEAHNVKALALWELNRVIEADNVFAAALTIAPTNAELLFNRGELYRETGQYDLAQVDLERAVKVAEIGSINWAKAKMTLGLIKKQQGAIEEALEFYDSVLRVCPDNTQTLVNRGEVKQPLGDLDGAYADFTKAVLLDPESAAAKFALACLDLLQREWSTGWENFEARWGMKDFNSIPRTKKIPAWNGSTQADEKLLIWGEQGLGDQVMFISQLSDLVDRKTHFALEVDKRLVTLLRRSFPLLEVYEYDMVPEDFVPKFDAQVPLGSLGRFLRSDVSFFPKPKAYLKSDIGQTSRLRKTYERLASGRKIVGISWHSINAQIGQAKSLQLHNWRSILTTENVLFVSLQYGDVKETVRDAVQQYGAEIFIDESVNPMEDFDAAASQVAAMDLVVSTSNTTVHLAGALGQQVWVMVPAYPEWRWGLKGNSVPWYQNVRVFRQPTVGDWDTVLDQVAHELGAWTAKT